MLEKDNNNIGEIYKFQLYKNVSKEIRNMCVSTRNVSITKAKRHVNTLLSSLCVYIHPENELCFPEYGYKACNRQNNMSQAWAT